MQDTLCFQRFAEQPKYTEVNPGQDALLTCKIIDKRGTCSWQKDNKFCSETHEIRRLAMPSNLRELEHKIGYFFKNPTILKEATTHSSLRTTNRDIKYFERLEFLGDTVVQMVITEYLFTSLDEASEGTLSIRRAELVGRCKQTDIANQLQLSRFIDKSPGLQDTFKRYDQFLEAIIGAVYADAGFGGQGLDEAKSIVYKLWKIQPSNSRVTELNCSVM